MRRLALLVMAALALTAALASTAGAVDGALRDCLVRNGARYTTPDNPRTAQYVGVSGLCKSGDGIVVSVTADPAGGGSTAPSGGGSRDQGTGGAVAPAGGGGGGDGGGAQPEAAPGPTAPRGSGDATAVSRVRDALDGGGSGGSLLSASGSGVPAAAWLALIVFGGLAGAGAVYRIAGRR